MDSIRYRTITTIKETEKSSVVLALMEGYEDPVIIKRLHNANPEVYRILLQVENVHLPRIYALEQQEDILVVAEEYVDGETLKHHLEQGKLTEEQKLIVAMQLCEAVEGLHSCNPPIIHRDIKPSNIIISENGIVKLIDFDVSRQYKKVSETGDTKVLGTPEYAAPEQYGYKQTDERSDIYSIGIVLERLDFHGRGLSAILWKRLLNICTSFDPKKRYKRVKLLAKDIRTVMTMQRFSWAYLCAALVSVMLIVIGALFLSKASGEVAHPDSSPVPTSTVAPTPIPEPTQTPTLTPTSTPEPTQMPTSTPEPIQTETPMPTGTPKPTPEQEKPDSIIMDSMEGQIYVENYYQSYQEPTEFLLYSSFFETMIGVVYATMTDLTSGEEATIPEEAYRMEDSIFHLDAEYMNQLQSTYYRLKLGLLGYGSMECLMCIRVHSPEDPFVEGDTLQGNYLDYYYENHDKLHVVLRSETKTKIVGLNFSMESQVPEDQYCILYDGRALELSAELLEQCKNDGSTIFYVVLDNGSKEKVTINNPYR